MRLLLIRHGESEGNLEGRIQGWDDYPLTNRGRRQAARSAERLAEEESIQEIVTSPLARAAVTAEIIGGVLGLPVRYDERLKEYNFGPVSGLTRDEIKTQYPAVWTAWQLNEFWEPLPGEEGEPARRAHVLDHFAHWSIGDRVPGAGRGGVSVRRCVSRGARGWRGHDPGLDGSRARWREDDNVGARGRATYLTK